MHKKLVLCSKTSEEVIIILNVQVFDSLGQGAVSLLTVPMFVMSSSSTPRHLTRERAEGMMYKHIRIHLPYYLIKYLI